MNANQNNKQDHDHDQTETQQDQGPYTGADMLRHIELGLIDPSPYQPRKHFALEPLQELSESIVKHGQIDAAVVRPSPAVPGRFELVAGERRWRACELGGVPTLKCQVREMSDEDAMELVIIQQVQHAQWSTTEEAEGYRALLAMRDAEGKPRFTYESLAARIDRKEAYIREMVSILDVPVALQAAVDAGEVSKRAAALVSGVLPERREEAAQRVLKPSNQLRPLSARQTVEMIQEHFMRSLQGAPFSTKDAALVPAAGTCTDCPLRTGNMAVFSGGGGRGRGGASENPEAMNANLCTNPGCYRAKCEAMEESLKERGLAAGYTLMDDEEAAELFDEAGELRGNIDYVDLAGRPDPALCHHYDQSKLPTWKSLIKEHGAHEVQVWLAKNPVTGKLQKLIKCEDAVRSVNAGSREKAGKPYFAGAAADGAPQGNGDVPVPSVPVVEDSVFDSASDETIRPGDNIMLPDGGDDGALWDKDAERGAKREQKAKEKADAKRAKELLGRMHRVLPELLVVPERGIAIKRLFAQHMLQIIGAEDVVNDLCRYYGVMPETEESLEDLLREYDGMGPFDGTTLVMMTLVRRCVRSYGVGSEEVAEWCEVLGIEQEGTAEDAETRSVGDGEEEQEQEQEPVSVDAGGDAPQEAKPAKAAKKAPKGKKPAAAKKVPAAKKSARARKTTGKGKQKAKGPRS